MDKTKFEISVIIGALGVIAGAFGAHALKAVLTSDQLNSWKTAVLYLFIHVLLLLILSGGAIKGDKKVISQSWTAIAVGILLFSGSIFLLSLQDVLGIDLSLLGPITPIGGVCFIGGWLWLLRLSSIEDR